MLDRDHITEIDRVLNGEETGRDRLVNDSWRRCVERYGMDPTRPDPAYIVSETRLREHREQSERLIAIARSGLQTLFRQVAGQNYVLLLADAKGVCVDFFGDPRFEDELRQAGLYLGSDWSEDLAGTCGVGSCLVTGEAITIHQSDHFGLAHTPLSCTAAPIYDTGGQLTAVLDISLLRSPSPKSSQNLALSLVTASARRVEMANLMASSRRDWVLRFSTSPEFLDVDPEAAVALDGSGRIIGMTKGAEQLAPDHSGSLIGRHIEDLIEVSVDDLPDLMRGRPTEERVLRLKDGRALFGHAIAPQSAPVPSRDRARAGLGALSGIAGPDPAMAQLAERASRLARTMVPVTILGETGTGKEYLARAIHVSGASGRSFHALRCAGLTADAVRALAEAVPGTLFLRGVEDLSAEAQGALLGLLDARDDLRVIAAAGPQFDAASSPIRSDLFFRLSGAVLTVPALRLRRDFDWLLERLFRRRAPEDMRLTPAARIELAGRDWPGNIRELAHALDAAVALAEGGVIDLTDLPPRLSACAAEAGAEPDLEALLAACEWNMSQVARRLGVNRSTVLRRVRKAGLTTPS
ncbi:sigma-54-dependent Fis family transcriptional regulator [Primorskyibacter aestuariivivens]|uniref:sigma-54-dependent Fis family transcriptional regulator n=1 Tax=Primorskyibacter aestuariivivens TaxID=1888912 RepID=UPI0023012363|nr:sigma-54-dependent Fis family transcriptional regulator [Primorskyibacter aestuariivivens]MDA7428870.1 sigma-54-dependent Fis family transcriptional regulator [Primorskyibacter aestuariivivens]